MNKLFAFCDENGIRYAILEAKYMQGEAITYIEDIRALMVSELATEYQAEVMLNMLRSIVEVGVLA